MFGRRIGKDDASMSASTSTSAALRRLNINLSAEVAGFQLERRDSRGTYTQDKKLSLPEEVRGFHSHVCVCVCVSKAHAFSGLESVPFDRTHDASCNGLPVNAMRSS